MQSILVCWIQGKACCGWQAKVIQIREDSQCLEPCRTYLSVSGTDFSDYFSLSSFPDSVHLCSQEQSEVVDSAAAERDFIGKLIDVLKNKEAGIKQDKFVIKTHAEVTELSEEELDALQSFCIIKIRRVLQELISEQASGGKSRKQQRGFTSKASEASDLNCIVPHQLMNRIRLRNIRETIKQVTEAQVHKSSLCPDCKKKKAELAKITFLRQKKILMERALLREKLEERIYSRDVLTLIGETLRSFPKLSEDPRNLWQKLKGKAEGMTAFCEHLKSSALLKE
ncbi:uncharacterized protein C8orf48 homolog isoform X2 [Centrocercus urophasianus]|uniref:uncharacterized protein C8orf48 homolog isoform X2 n=1 Tax=Centrocercus urophasianus TaxID=9002 RepID=UPI001C64F29D|nr:uncharacterized protein C8orf48 homolog isoform X2 [Centrocercus urophasianus]